MTAYSNDTNSTITLKQAVNRILFILQMDNSLFLWTLESVINCIIDVNIFHLTRGIATKPVVLDIDPHTNTAKLPTDYFDYLILGYVRNGQVVPLTYNEDIAIPVTSSCGQDENEYKGAKILLPEWGYGTTGGQSGIDFKIDKRARRIIIIGNIPGMKLYLEYKSSGISLSGETLVPREMLSALTNYVKWQNERLKSDKNARLTQYDGNVFGQSIVRLKDYESSISCQRFYDAIMSGYSQTVKR